MTHQTVKLKSRAGSVMSPEQAVRNLNSTVEKISSQSRSAASSSQYKITSYGSYTVAEPISNRKDK